MAEASEFLSVIIPTRNRKPTLGRCLDALAAQTLPKERYEIIVIDDGSTDGTNELLKEYAGRIPGLKILSQAHEGPAKARNLGVRNARGTIVLFTGDDCIADKRLLEEHLRLHRSSDALAVLGRIEWHPELDVTPFMKFLVIDTQFSYPIIEKTAEYVPFGYFYTSNISVRKSALEKAGGFDEEFPYAACEDVELGYRLWRSGVRMIYNPRALTYHHHKVELKDYIDRQMRTGKAAAIFYRKHPELVDFLGLPRIVGGEVRARYYKAVCDYYYYAGLQEGMEAEKKDAQFIPLEDRLLNWSHIEKDRLVKQILQLEAQPREFARQIRALNDHIRHLNREIDRREKHIAGIAGEITRRDKLIETLTAKNAEKSNRIIELEKFELRVKSTLPFKLLSALKKLMGKR